MENIGLKNDTMKIFGYEVWAQPERSFGSKLSKIQIFILKLVATLFDILVNSMTFFL